MSKTIWLARNDVMDRHDDTLMVFIEKPYWCAPVWVETIEHALWGQLRCQKPFYLTPGECKKYQLVEIEDYETIT